MGHYGLGSLGAGVVGSLDSEPVDLLILFLCSCVLVFLCSCVLVFLCVDDVGCGKCLLPTMI